MAMVFPGSDSLTSSLQNPTGICYNSYGSFDVTLIACNGNGCDTLLLPGFINEYGLPVPTITQSNDTLFSSPGVSYQWWSVDSGIITGATNYYYLPLHGGNYFVVITDSIGCEGASNSINVTFAGIAQFAGSGFPVIISPNPNHGNFTVTFNQTIKDISLRIVNPLGQTVYSRGWAGFQPLSDKSITIHLEDVAPGLYAVELIAGEKIYKQLFIKE